MTGAEAKNKGPKRREYTRQCGMPYEIYQLILDYLDEKVVSTNCSIHVMLLHCKRTLLHRTLEKLLQL